MMKDLLSMPLCIGMSTLAIVHLPALAQQNEGAVGLEEVVVTAERRVADVQNIGASRATYGT